MPYSNRALRLMKSKKAEARRVKKVAPLHWEQQNPAGLSSWWSRGSVCACACVYIGVTSSALRRAWLGLVDGGGGLIRTKPASTASILLFLWRLYALIAKRAHLPRAHLNSNAHVCRLLHSLDVISKLWWYHFQFRATLACYCVNGENACFRILCRGLNGKFVANSLPVSLNASLQIVKLLLVAYSFDKLASFGSVRLGWVLPSGDNLRGRRLGFAWSLAARMFWRLQTSRKRGFS